MASMCGPLQREGNSKIVYIQTFGCQMNEYDTDKMFEVLRGEDYQETSSPEENTPTLICLLTLILFKPREDNIPTS